MSIDTEKITINLPVVDLGKIDLLVDEGLFSTRTDVMKTALRNLLDKHFSELTQATIRHSYIIGALIYDKASLEKLKANGELLDATVIGLLKLAEDVTPDLADATIARVKVRGAFRAAEKVKAALADRTV